MADASELEKTMNDDDEGLQPTCRVCGIRAKRGEGGAYREEGFFCTKDRCLDIGCAIGKARRDHEIATLRMNGFCIFWDEFLGFCGVNGYNNYPAAFDGKTSPLSTRVPQKAVPGTDYCPHHTTLRCGCGAQANGECGFIGSSPFVCRAAICSPLQPVEKDGKNLLSTKCGAHHHTVEDRK